jgi:hypothetical protein
MREAGAYNKFASRKRELAYADRSNKNPPRM